MIKQHDRPARDARHLQLVGSYYQTGDERILAPLLVELRAIALAYARGQLRMFDVQRAEDLVQESMIRLLTMLRNRVELKRPPGVLLCVICHGKFVNGLGVKSTKATQPGRHEDPFLLVGPAGTTAAEELPVHAEEEAQAGATLAAVSEAVFSLDPNAQAAVVLHFYQGLPASEAADRMGVTESLFKERLNRGLASLREWAAQQDAPTAEVYAALRRVDSGDLFRESGRQTK